MPKTLRPSAADHDAFRGPHLPPQPPDASPGRRWRFRRDLVIYLAHRQNGLSQRMLADVFDLPRSRIGEIIANFQQHDRSVDE